MHKSSLQENEYVSDKQQIPEKSSADEHARQFLLEEYKYEQSRANTSYDGIAKNIGSFLIILSVIFSTASFLFKELKDGSGYNPTILAIEAFLFLFAALY